MSDLFDDLDFEMLGGDFEDPFENEPVDPMPPPVPGMPNAGHQPVQHPKAAVQKASEADCTEGPAQHRILAPPHQASAEAFTNAEAQVTKADDNAADTAAYQEEVSNQTGPEQIPTLNMMVSLADQTEAAAAQQDTRTLMELPPVFKYGSCEEDISDGDMTFEQLRAEKEPDFLELEDSKRVSWTVQYGRVTKPISSPAKQKIAQVKEEIELSKEFLEGLKKAKDKRPRCFVKPTVAGKSKGIAAYSITCLQFACLAYEAAPENVNSMRHLECSMDDTYEAAESALACYCDLISPHDYGDNSECFTYGCYYSSKHMMEFYRLCRVHAKLLRVKLHEEPFFARAKRFVYSQLGNAYTFDYPDSKRQDACRLYNSPTQVRRRMIYEKILGTNSPGAFGAFLSRGC